MKPLGVFLLLPGWDASPSQGLPPALILLITLSYTWVERATMRVKCLAKEHNTLPLRPGLEPVPLTLESLTLILRPPCLPPPLRVAILNKMAQCPKRYHKSSSSCRPFETEQRKGGETRDTKTLNLSRNIVLLQVFVDVSRFSPGAINLTRNKNICCRLKKCGALIG